MVKPTADPEQLALDLEGANDRLRQMHKAIADRDAAADEVRQLTLRLAQAKRRLKEAGWTLSAIIAAEKRRQLPPP